MKKFCLTISIAVFLLFLLNGLQAQTTPTKLNQVVIGSIDSIHSKMLNEQRKIWVYVPSSASDEMHSRNRYPVVYLLDGDEHFSSVVGMIHQLSSVNGNAICPEMIVVGILNTDRTRDLTPTHISSFLPVFDSVGCKTSGGGGKFISFIEKELMPHIDSLYPTAPYRILIGHSFGGLTVMNTLIHYTNLFNAYVAIDPSMWWDNQRLLKEFEKSSTNANYKGVSLFLGIANTMAEGMDTIEVKKDTTRKTLHIRSILELNNYLKSREPNQLKYMCKYYENDDHGSVPLITEYDALHFIFDYYHFKLSYSDTTVYKVLISKMENHYDNLSKHLGYSVKPPEGDVNRLAFGALNSKHFEEAIYLFNLNAVNYPESSDAYDSLGDYYVAKADKPNAINSYKKALSIKEVPETRRKLEKLQSK